MRQFKSMLGVRQLFFSFLFIIDTNRTQNALLQLTSTILEVTVLHYFYVHPHFTFLANYRLFQNYFSNIYKYIVVIHPFSSANFTLLTLSFYPIIIIIIFFIKKYGPNKILLPLVQISIFLYPLLSIKIMIELINAFFLNAYLYLSIPFGLITLTFGSLLSILSGKSYRMLEYPLILFLQLGANIYFLFAVLLIRLAAVGYLLYPVHKGLFGYCFECSMLAILFACNFCDDEFINYIGFGFLIFSTLLFGLNEIRKAYEEEKTILDYADELEEEEKETLATLQVYRRVEIHHVECDFMDCPCQQFYTMCQKDLKKWVYHFQQMCLSRSQSFEGRSEYAEKCCSHYDFKLSGLVRICQTKPKGLLEEYKIYKICSIYEINLRKQDKNYRYGEPYKNSQEELQQLHQSIAEILQKIRVFWTLIKSFDGSTKFLNQILLISKAITKLKSDYNKYEGKYDQELKEFKYAYDLFSNIILNEQTIEEDQFTVPQPTPFVVTNGEKIINANNSFLLLSSHTASTLIGSSYTSLIPEVYKDIHSQWANTFIEKVEHYQDKTIDKCLSVGTIELRMVEMEHRILPRFLDGLQIYTIVRQSTKRKKPNKQSFIFLVQKQTFYIKNVQASFFDIIKFKVNQRNFKILQQTSLTSVFQNFSLTLSQNPNRQVALFPHFLEEFTYAKAKKKSEKKSRRSANITIRTRNSNIDQSRPVFEFAVLPNNRNEDPYLKIQFSLKQEQDEEDKATSQQSKGNEQLSQSGQQKRQKQQNSYGFFIPYYLVLSFAVCHVFFILGRNSFNNAIHDVANRYEFYLNFDYTTLSVLNATTGIDRTEELRTLWIEGYGDFSESFNSFRRVKQPYFLSYFNSRVTVEFHNQLFSNIQAAINSANKEMSNYRLLLLVCLIALVGHFVLDLFFSLKYTFHIESRVGALLLQFVIVQTTDVNIILSTIGNFEANILSIDKSSSANKLPIETVEQSALQLLRGGGISLNNSASLNGEPQQNQSSEKYLVHNAKRSLIQEKNRISVSFVKESFRSSASQGLFKRQRDQIKEFDEQKDKSIVAFKQKYRSWQFIMGANKLLFLLIVCGVAMGVGVILASVTYLHLPLSTLPKHIEILDALQQSRIILLKSQTQILINSTQLQPTLSLSNNLLRLISLSGSSGMTNFHAQFLRFNNQDVCSAVDFNCTLLTADKNLHVFGMKVMTQYIESYFRQKNKTALTESTLQNQLIKYNLVLLTQLIKDLIDSSKAYCEKANESELNLVIVGSFVVLIGLMMNHYSLREFRNRIENSRNLLRIIPKEIKEKQGNEMELLTLEQVRSN